MKAIASFIPVYYQLAEDLKQQIESGTLKPGDIVLSESQLGIEYGISRMTVRRGLALLLESGLIETVRGKGNFVAKPRLQQATLTFKEDALVNGEKAEFKFVEVKRVPVEGEIAAMLNIPEGTKVFAIRRLIRSDKNPVGIDIKYIPYLKGKPILENEIEYAYFPDIVARHTDVMINKIERRIMATSLQSAEAELLKTGTDHPALCVIQVIYAKDGKPLGVSKTIYRGEAFELRTVSFPYSGI
ncbi:MAG: GntR family transcriptional regulator, partial [Thermacetogeniaceae bacterium]